MVENRLSLFLCLGIFGALSVLAIVFYQERIINLDMAFQTFLILKSGSIEIQSGRFGAAATQFWPWAAQAMGLSLKGVLMAYSLGHALWPAILAFFCWRIGQWRWSLAIGLVATLMTTHTFYWLSEMQAGLAFLCAVFAWMHSKGSLTAFRWWEWPLWLGALVTAFYFHPLVLYAHAFLCLFFLLEKDKPRAWAWMHLTALGIFGALAILKYKVLKLDWYDAIAIKRQEAFGKLWPYWFDIESNRKFLEWSSQDYWLLWTVIAVCLGYYIWYKSWANALFVAGWSLAFVLMVNVPYYEAVGQQFYMENLYLPLAVFASIPLIFDVLRDQNLRARSGLLALTILFALNLFRIGQTHQTWTDKLQWEQTFLKETASRTHRKIVLSEKQVPTDTLKMTWGSSYEFLMLSALAHPDSARCLIIHDSPEHFDSLLTRPRLFFGAFKNYPFEALPKGYFNFRDTSGYVRW
ncbi:MAG: hypothetical protein Q7T20_03690 [Saprospiraceae bacterium]|nr:hypothetical protein [Saprospiraceae bacterium]